MQMKWANRERFNTDIFIVYIDSQTFQSYSYSDVEGWYSVLIDLMCSWEYVIVKRTYINFFKQQNRHSELVVLETSLLKGFSHYNIKNNCIITYWSLMGLEY